VKFPIPGAIYNASGGDVERHARPAGKLRWNDLEQIDNAHKPPYVL
jgi:hypothetical protein